MLLPPFGLGVAATLKLDVSAERSQALRTLNKLRKTAMVTLGRKVKLDFSRVSAEHFAAPRVSPTTARGVLRDASHRRHGELFGQKQRVTVDNRATARQPADLAGRQYNPDVDFNDVQPGATITLPRVAPINRQ